MTSANVSNVPISPAQTVREKKSSSKNPEESMEFYQMMQSSMTKDMSQMGSIKNTDKTDLASVSASGADSFAVSAPAKSDDISAAKSDVKDVRNTTETKNTSSQTKGQKTDKIGMSTKETDKASELSEEDQAAVAEAVSQFAEGVVNLFEDAFGVTEDQLSDAMEDLGFTFSDLLVPNNAAELAATVMGEEDDSAILILDGGKEFLEGLANLTAELADALPAELTPIDLKSVETGISVNDLLAEGMEQVVPEVYEGDVNADPAVFAKKIDDSPVEQTEEVAVARDPLAREAISMTSEKEDNEELSEMSDGPVDLSAENTPVTKSNTRPGENSSQQDQGNMPRHSATPETKTENVVSDNAQPQAQVNTEFTTENVSEVRSYASIDTRDVIEQVVTAARTQITDSVRSIELELNPHNLGKMIMQVTEREGELTARLVAENQSVKEALESQLANLRDRLNEQGVKVTSVEVAVATHEFEQNLEEGQMNQTFDQQSGQDNGSEAASSERRAMRGGINLGNPDDLVDLTEAEALEASMMADAGNSVSYRA